MAVTGHIPEPAYKSKIEFKSARGGQNPSTQLPAILSFVYDSILTCQRAIRRTIFVKNCKRRVSKCHRTAFDPARIIHSVPRMHESTFRRIVLRSLLAIVVLLAISYVADAAVFHYRLANQRQPFGSVAVEHYTAVEHKDGRAELFFDPPVQ